MNAASQKNNSFNPTYDDTPINNNKSEQRKNDMYSVQETREPASGKVLERLLRAAQSSGNLNLSNRGMTYVPNDVFNIEELQLGQDDKWWEREPLKKLDLGHNSISIIPDQIEKLQEHLTTLILCNNTISVIPIQLTQLINLTKLDLSHNNIIDVHNIPFDNITTLNELLLNHNKLTKVIYY
jgi:Leucine-rich repeat (LRR) protein